MLPSNHNVFCIFLEIKMKVKQHKILIWILKDVMNSMIVCFENRSYKIDFFFVFHSWLFTEADNEDNTVMPGMGTIAMHASNKDDPLLEIKDDVNCFTWATYIYKWLI